MKRPLKPAGFPISQIHSFENFLETLTSVKMSDKLAFLSDSLTKLKMSDFQTQCLTYGNYGTYYVHSTMSPLNLSSQVYFWGF